MLLAFALAFAAAFLCDADRGALRMAAIRGLAAMASSRSMGVSAETGAAAAFEAFAAFAFAALVAAAGVAGEAEAAEVAAAVGALGVGAAVGWCAGAAACCVATGFSSSRFSRSTRLSFFSSFFAALPESFNDELTRLQTHTVATRERQHQHSRCATASVVGMRARVDSNGAITYPAALEASRAVLVTDGTICDVAFFAATRCRCNLDGLRC